MEIASLEIVLLFVLALLGSIHAAWINLALGLIQNHGITAVAVNILGFAVNIAWTKDAVDKEDAADKKSLWTKKMLQTKKMLCNEDAIWMTQRKNQRWGFCCPFF